MSFAWYNRSKSGRGSEVARDENSDYGRHRVLSDGIWRAQYIEFERKGKGKSNNRARA
jgi:hypothetical protein